MPHIPRSSRFKTVLVSLIGAAILAPMMVPSPAFASIALDAEEAAFCTIINNYRSSKGLPALMVSPTITNASEWMSTDMATKNYFSHTDSLGRDPFQRMAAFGYGFNTYKGENIAAGYATATDTFNQWKNSSGHNANMLNANFKVIGIGKASNTSSTYRHYWTTGFGGTVDSGSIPCPGSTAPAPAPTTLPAVSVSDVSMVEGTSSVGGTKLMQFKVTIPAASTQQVSVNFATGNGTAFAGSDYHAASGKVTIPAGARSAVVSVKVVMDRTREPNETLVLRLSSPVNATIARSAAVGTILNDD
ncbi:MAG TPA: CAP domain-containing protein [Actinomycetota bacterium]|nr:CAP domain-containing protein [Actinomycetota bacterium]